GDGGRQCALPAGCGTGRIGDKAGGWPQFLGSQTTCSCDNLANLAQYSRESKGKETGHGHPPGPNIQQEIRRRQEVGEEKDRRAQGAGEKACSQKDRQREENRPASGQERIAQRAGGEACRRPEDGEQGAPQGRRQTRRSENRRTCAVQTGTAQRGEQTGAGSAQSFNARVETARTRAAGLETGAFRGTTAPAVAGRASAGAQAAQAACAQAQGDQPRTGGRQPAEIAGSQETPRARGTELSGAAAARRAAPRRTHACGEDFAAQSGKHLSARRAARSRNDLNVELANRFAPQPGFPAGLFF